MDLRDVYRDILLDHRQNPRHCQAPATDAVLLRGDCPECMDALLLAYSLDKEGKCMFSYEGEGCAMATASVSLLTTYCRGKTLAEVRELTEAVLQLLRGEELTMEEEVLGNVMALSAVKAGSARERCARFPWEVLWEGLGE